MIPRLKPAIGSKELLAMFAFWRKNSVDKFENKFKNEMNCSYALSFSYGRTALYSILKALFPKGGEVICPSYTCVVVPHAIVTAGCMPVFVDSSTEDFNMDLNLVDGAVTDKTVAIIATSIFGYPINLTALSSLKRRYPKIIIIQDCSHSFIALDGSYPVHLAGDFAIFAFNISKMMTSIFGGMLTTNNKEYYEKLKKFRQNYCPSASFNKSLIRTLYLISAIASFNRRIYGFINYLERKSCLNHFVKYFDPAIIDMPKDFLVSLSPVEARVGIEQCSKLRSIIFNRQFLARIYYSLLQKVEAIKLPPYDLGASFSHFVIICDCAHELSSYLLRHGVQVGNLIDYNIPNLPVYRKYRFINKNIACNWPNRVINLPVHMGINRQDVVYICSLIKIYFGIDA